MALTLGRLESGQYIDLQAFLDKVCAEMNAFEELVKSLVRDHPEWRSLARQATDLYLSDLAHMEPLPVSYETAKQLNLSVEAVTLANGISTVTLFGLSHYLQWNGFEIENPTDFGELSTKLAFVRNAVAKIGFHMVLSRKLKSKIPSKPVLSKDAWLSQCYQDGFMIGLSLGYLIADTHSTTPDISAEFLG